MDIQEKLRILADSAKYDVSCSTSGVGRGNTGNIGNAYAPGICHTWSADGRCVSLLKVLYSNDCCYDCEFCVNRRRADAERATFEPEELAELTIEFYRRNYIEGLFISSAVKCSPDYTSERMLECLKILRFEKGFAGYIHCKLVPGTGSELIHAIGLLADRVSVNMELPSDDALKLLTPQKKAKHILAPMKQVTNTLIERGALKGPGNMFSGIDVNDPSQYLSGGKWDRIGTDIRPSKNLLIPEPEETFSYPSLLKEKFAPAGQTTQFIVGAAGESDREILTLSENLYHTFKMKRVYFSAYVPVVDSPMLPGDPPQLGREHRLYQADWLLRFYGFRAEELFKGGFEELDADLDPKITWAIRNIERFPMEINRVSYAELLRIPGIGNTSAKRIMQHRRLASVTYDELKKMGVVLKRAKYFITVGGKFYGEKTMEPDTIRNHILGMENGIQMSMFDKSDMVSGEKKIGLLV